MKQKCKSLFCALLCLVLMCATALPVWAAATAPAFGTDVSQHNGKGVDYTAWKKAGKTFTMIRMSYGNDHLDPQFWDNVNAAEAAGVPFGVYHYSYAYNTKEATIEANYVKSVLAQMKGKYKCFVLPVAYDLEDQKILNNSNKKTIIQHATTFCDAIRAAGYTPMVYANMNWFTNYLDVQTLHSKGYKLWYANWQPKTTDFPPRCRLAKPACMRIFGSMPRAIWTPACRIIMCCGILKRWLRIIQTAAVIPKPPIRRPLVNSWAV